MCLPSKPEPKLPSEVPGFWKFRTATAESMANATADCEVGRKNEGIQGTYGCFQKWGYPKMDGL